MSEAATNPIQPKEEERSTLTPDDNNSGVSDKIPANKLSLRFLLVNGNKSEVMYNLTDTILDVKKNVLANWPKEFGIDAPSDISKLRILHLGRMLDNSVTLEASKIPAGQATVVHLLISGNGASNNSAAKLEKKSGGCSCIIQ